jgi:hypothetical protein
VHTLRAANILMTLRWKLSGLLGSSSTVSALRRRYLDGHSAPQVVTWRKHLALLIYLALTPMGRHGS